MKRVFSSLVIILLVFSLVSCSNSYIINAPEENSHPDFSDLPYLSAVKNSLNCIFNNDEDGYWHTQELNVENMFLDAKYPERIKETNPNMDESEIVEIISRNFQVGQFRAYADFNLKDVDQKESFINEINNEIKKHGVKNIITGIEEIQKSKYEDKKDMLKDIYDVDASEVRYIKVFLEADDYYGSNEAEMECYPYLIDNQWYAYFDSMSFI